jgi:cell division protein FtsB
MAEDFHAAFGLGKSAQQIATVDADGVALAAIQGLNAKLEAENAALREEMAALRTLRAEMAALRALVESRLPAEH